jgi:hypothetical protein
VTRTTLDRPSLRQIPLPTRRRQTLRRQILRRQILRRQILRRQILRRQVPRLLRAATNLWRQRKQSLAAAATSDPKYHSPFHRAGLPYWRAI